MARKKFAELVAKMSPESRGRMEKKTEATGTIGSISSIARQDEMRAAATVLGSGDVDENSLPSYSSSA
jgi:hypothetical protein